MDVNDATTVSTDSTTAFQAQDAGGTTVLGVDTSGDRIFSGIPDSATAIGFTLDTPAYTTGGAKLFSVQNDGTEQFYIDKDGNVFVEGGKLQFNNVGNDHSALAKKFICTAAAGLFNVVIIDTANPGQVTTTTTANSPLVVGIVGAFGVTAGSECPITIGAGVTQVAVDTAAVNVGDLLVTSSTAGRATVNNSPAVGTVFGKALSSKAAGSNGTIWVLLGSG
ncbi:MAG: capsid cement protein [Patescibacteria group bacterium]